MFNLLPGARGSGRSTNFVNPDTELILYLDERESNEHLFIGGTLVLDDESSDMTVPLNQYKTLFRPEHQPTEWFLKGSGKWLLNDDELEESSDEALTRWILWAKFLKSFDVFYQFHSVSVNKETITYESTSRSRRNVERYQRAYEALFRTLEQQRFCKIKVVTDNVEGAQLTGLQRAIDESDSYLDKKIQLLPPIAKTDRSSNHSAWLQFVDMQIYALSRFIFPSGQNVLMDFEKFAYEHAQGTILGTQQGLGNEKLEFMAAKYYILKDIFHHIRHRLVTNLLSPNYTEPLSTMAIVSAGVNFNFAAAVDGAIHSFCNTANSDVTFDFNGY